jgi:hypothetical protein
MRTGWRHLQVEMIPYTMDCAIPLRIAWETWCSLEPVNEADLTVMRECDPVTVLIIQILFLEFKFIFGEVYA